MEKQNYTFSRVQLIAPDCENEIVTIVQEKYSKARKTLSLLERNNPRARNGEF